MKPRDSAVNKKYSKFLPANRKKRGDPMYIIGENIHIIADSVKKAIKERDANFFQELAVKQVDAGADAIDLNLGCPAPRIRRWCPEAPRDSPETAAR